MEEVVQEAYIYTVCQAGEYFHLHCEKLFVRYLVTVLRLAMQYSVLEF